MTAVILHVWQVAQVRTNSVTAASIPGFIGQMTGRLTNQRIVASTIFVDHASDLSYVYHQTSMTSEETLKSKLAFEKFAASHGVNIKHYHVQI